MKKLLVAFDGSESSVRALHHAIPLARAAGGAIHLVTAYEPPIVYPDVGLTVPYGSIVAAQKEQAAEVLKEGEALLKTEAVPYTTEVLTGDVGKVIAECADTLGCDGIVMGTRGLGPIRGLVMGSVATKVVHAAHVPVTLVK